MKHHGVRTRLSRLFKRKSNQAEDAQDCGKEDDSTSSTGPSELCGAVLSDGIGLLEFPNDCGGPAAGVDIIFVHGLRGSRVKTWSSGSIFWPQKLLANDIQDARIITWGYDTEIANAFSYASNASLFGHAGTLLNDLARVRVGITRPIIFVCHSLGGLVVKEALITSDNFCNHNRHPALGQIYASTIGVVFLGTPHGGSGKETYGDILAKVAKLTLRQPNTQLLETLRKDSHLLERQRNDFTTISNKMCIVCVKEEKPTAIGTIVPQTSAIYQGFNVIPGSSYANHMEMARFRSREDVGYKRMMGFIRTIRDTERREIEAENERIESQNQYILDTLAFPMMGYREESIDDAYAESCSWILPDESEDANSTDRSSRLLTWLRSSGEPFLWISGKAGCGKSTAMKYVYHSSRTRAELERGQWQLGKTLIIAAHFFHDRGNSDQKSREGMLRCLLHMLLSENRHLIREAFAKWDLFPTARLNSITDPDGLFLKWANLCDAFISVLHHLTNSKICLFLDGLDKYRMTGREKQYTEQELDLIFDGENEDEGWGRSKWITDGHREIARFLRRLRPFHNVKVCVSSRELNVFDDEFKTFSRIRVHEFTTSAIAQYCESRLADEAPNLEDSFEFASAITSKSRGVFLWVRLVVDMLVDGYSDGSYKHELWRMVDSCPNRLGGRDGLYMRMMLSINRTYLGESKRLFQLMIMCDEMRSWNGSRFLPDNLELDIITLFLAEEGHSQESPIPFLKAKTDKFLFKTWEKLQPRWTELARRLKSRCAGLLEGTRNVQFMHQTAKQFLSRRYLWDQIFSDSRGFHDNHEIYLALQSGFLRRLKCSSRAVRHARFQRPVYNTETTDIRSGFILPIDTALGETEGFNAPSFGLFDYDFGPVAPLSLAIVKIATRMRDQKYQRWCHEILDELDSVGCQLAREATGDEFDEFDDAEWVSLFMDYGREDGISCSRTFLDVVIFFDLSTYLAAKIVEHGLGQDQLTSLLARAIHMHSFFWRNTGLVHTVDVTQHSETIHVLLKKGADPNGREAVSRLGRNEIDSVRTSWTGLLVKIRMQENLMSTDRIHSARICPLVKRFLDCGADPIAQWYWTSRDGNKEFLTPRIVVELISEFIVGPEWKEILGILASAEEKAKRAVATASV